MSTAKKAAIAGAIIVCAPFVIAGMISGAKQNLSSKPAAQSTPAAKASASKKPAFKLTPEPHHLAPASKREKAAAILKAEDTSFRTFLAQGQQVVGTPKFTAWYQKAIVGLDMQQTAFKNADALFTVKTEPTDLIEAWRTDNGDANSAITQFAQDGTSPDAPNADTKKDAKDALAALAKADKDTDKIAAGQ